MIVTLRLKRGSIGMRVRIFSSWQKDTRIHKHHHKYCGIECYAESSILGPSYVGLFRWWENTLITLEGLLPRLLHISLFAELPRLVNWLLVTTKTVQSSSRRLPLYPHHNMSNWILDVTEASAVPIEPKDLCRRQGIFAASSLYLTFLCAQAHLTPTRNFFMSCRNIPTSLPQEHAPCRVPKVTTKFCICSLWARAYPPKTRWYPGSQKYKQKILKWRCCCLSNLRLNLKPLIFQSYWQAHRHHRANTLLLERNA